MTLPGITEAASGGDWAAARRAGVAGRGGAGDQHALPQRAASR